MYIQCSDGDDGEGEVEEEEEEGVGGGVRGSNERSMEEQDGEGEEEEQRVMRRHHEDTFTRKLERWLTLTLQLHPILVWDLKTTENGCMGLVTGIS